MEIPKKAEGHCREHYGKSCATVCKLKVLCTEYNTKYHTDEKDAIVKKIENVVLSWGGSKKNK